MNHVITESQISKTVDETPVGEFNVKELSFKIIHKLQQNHLFNCCFIIYLKQFRMRVIMFLLLFRIIVNSVGTQNWDTI